jgi:type IV fimbrial biogenesis protein FimT
VKTKINNASSATQRGFTLVELITTMSICTILAAIGFVSIQSWQRNNEARQLFMDVARVLNFARSSALVYNSAISVCGGSISGCSGEWRDGMLVFTDVNHNGKIDTVSDRILLQTPLELDYGDLTWRGAGGRPHIIFQETSLAMGSNGSLIYCGETPRHHRSIVLSNMGHSRRSLDVNGDGIYEHTDGKPFVCPKTK